MFTKLPELCRGFSLISALAALLSTEAIAMNQEGHEDWMADFPHAIALLDAIPEARPLPSPDCPVSREMLANNPYEQIPLPQHRCPGKLSPPRSQAFPASTR